MNITLKAMSPIAHGAYTDGVDTGNIMLFRKMPMLNSEGKIIQVPVLSGNSTRGNIRRLLAREYIDRLKIAELLGPGSFDKFYIAIANGGHLEKNLDVSVNPERLREIRRTLPILSVLGAALYRYMLSGVVSFGFAALKCKELGTGEQRITDLLTDIGLVRHLDREAANIMDVKPMPYTTECVVAGAEFSLEVSFAPQATELEKACIAHGFKLLKTVGGKSAAGFGKVEVVEDMDDTLYLDWMESLDEKHLEEVKRFVEEL